MTDSVIEKIKQNSKAKYNVGWNNLQRVKTPSTCIFEIEGEASEDDIKSLLRTKADHFGLGIWQTFMKISDPPTTKPIVKRYEIDAFSIKNITKEK
jgi:hypothetical protein